MSDRRTAAWARGGGRRTRPLKNLVADVRRLGRRMPDPETAPAPESKASGPAAVDPLGLAGAWLSRPWRPGRRVRLDGGDVPALPDGPVVLVGARSSTEGITWVLRELAASDRRRALVLGTRHSRGALASARRWLTRGGVVLLQPEGPVAAELASTTGAALIPFAVRGAASVGVSAHPRVAVRVGTPLGSQRSTEQQRRAVADLLTEDELTWWQVRRQHAEEVDGQDHPEQAASSQGWRQVWQQTAPTHSGGIREVPRIWR